MTDTRYTTAAPDVMTIAHYQPQYIAALNAMAKALRPGEKDAGLTFILHQNGDAPALVTFNRKATKPEEIGPRPDCLAVIMPYRTNAANFAGAGFTAAFLPTPAA